MILFRSWFTGKRVRGLLYHFTLVVYTVLRATLHATFTLGSYPQPRNRIVNINWAL